MRPNKYVKSEFLFYLIQSNIYQSYILNTCVSGATNQIGLSLNKLKDILFIYPKLEFQEKIINLLNTETAKIDKVAALIKLQIEKLKEYRLSLIYSAVTGKIKI